LNDGDKIKVITIVQHACDLLENSDCLALLALDHEGKQIIIAFRGGMTQDTPINEPTVHNLVGGKVNSILAMALNAVWSPLKSTLYKLSIDFSSYTVTFTGHSWGGALAVLASADWAVTMPTMMQKIELYTFGQPRVGNYNFAHKMFVHVPRAWRVVHRGDALVHTPRCSGCKQAQQTAS